MSDSINNIYIKAFNNAYLLAKYNSVLLEQILEIENSNEYFKGVADGKKIYNLQQRKTRMHEIERLRNKNDKDKRLEH